MLIPSRRPSAPAIHPVWALRQSPGLTGEEAGAKEHGVHTSQLAFNAAGEGLNPPVNGMDTRSKRRARGDAPVTVMGLSSPVAVMASPPVSRIARTVYPTPALQNTQTRGLWHTGTRRIYMILPLVAGPGEGEDEGEGREWRGGAGRGKARVRGCAPALGLGELHHERGVLGRHLGSRTDALHGRKFARLRLRSRRCTLALAIAIPLRSGVSNRGVTFSSCGAVGARSVHESAAVPASGTHCPVLPAPRGNAPSQAV